MGSARRQIFASVLGAASATGAVAAGAGCGGACLSCFGCAAVGIGVLLAACVGTEGTAEQPGRGGDAAVIARQEGDSHGMA